MPRDSSGNVSLPVSNPVVANTDITATWANDTMADLAAMIEDSLSRSGDGGLLVPFLNSSGTVNAPGIAFTSDTDTGVANLAANKVSLVAGGIKTLEATTTGVQVTGFLDVSSDAAILGNLAVSGTLSGSLVSKANLPAAGVVASASSGGGAGAVSTSLAWVQVTNLSRTITSVAGRPVIVSIQPADGTNEAYFQALCSTSEFAGGEYRLLRDLNPIAAWLLSTASLNGGVTLSATNIPANLTFIDTGAAIGAHTYTFEFKTDLVTIQIVAKHCSLVAYEL